MAVYALVAGILALGPANAVAVGSGLNEALRAFLRNSHSAMVLGLGCGTPTRPWRHNQKWHAGAGLHWFNAGTSAGGSFCARPPSPKTFFQLGGCVFLIALLQ